jgi:hypothetical protein
MALTHHTPTGTAGLNYTFNLYYIKETDIFDLGQYIDD